MNRRQSLRYASVAALSAASFGLLPKPISRAAAAEGASACPPYHTHHYSPTQQLLKRGQRLPKLMTRLGSVQTPARDTIPFDLLGDHEHLMIRVEMVRKSPIIVDGEPFGLPTLSAMTVSPHNGAHWSRYESMLASLLGKPKTISAYELELAYAVLDLDSGYYITMPGHTAKAVAAGVRVEALVALRDHRDEGLNKDEIEHVRFIRAVRDGNMTDALWDRMKRRMGSERGVVEYTWMVAIRNALHLFCWAIGTPELPRDEFNKMLRAAKPEAEKLIMTPNMKPPTVACTSAPWRVYHTPSTQELTKRARRLPKLPPRETILEDELVAYDTVAGRVELFKKVIGRDGKVDLIDGDPYGVTMWSAFGVSPLFGQHMLRGGLAVSRDEGKPGGISHLQHEFINPTLALDSGYYLLVSGRTPAAIAAGVRIEALEALRDHRDDLLTPVEKQNVDFIRAVRDGAMTDDIWARMKGTLGNDAACLDYVFYVLMLDMRARLCRAFGCPEMSRAQFNRILKEYRVGERKVPMYGRGPTD